MLIRSFSRIFPSVRKSFSLSRSLTSVSNQCKVEELQNRGLIQVSGEDSSQFLQGLTTNDMRLLESEDKNCIYTMFLNTKGRVLYDALIYNDPNGGFLIECDLSSVGGLIKHVRMYRLRKKVEFEPEKKRTVKVIFGDVKKLKTNNGDVLVEDPRIPDLGHRLLKSPEQSVSCDNVEGLYKETSISYNMPKTGDRWAMKMHNGKSREFETELPPSYPARQLQTNLAVHDDHYLYKLGIAEGETELSKGETFPLEMNLDYLSGVSFDKGCYLGQELTSRTKHTGVIRKRLMPLKFSAEIPSCMDLIEKEDGKKEKRLGKIRGVYGTLGLGLIRISDITSPALTAAGIIVKQPDWWPQEVQT